MKRMLVLILALVMVFAALPVVGAYAEEAPEITYSEHLTEGSSFDITDATIAWVKQANGALIIWVDADDARSDEEIIAQAKAADPSLANSVTEFTVMKGLGVADTPNTHGSQATVTVADENGKLVLSIEGKYSHCVIGSAAAAEEPEEPTAAAEEEKVGIRIDAPQKMAVAFADGTVYYGGEMKEVVVGQEYSFQMCSVNRDNGLFDGIDNGIRGTVVYRMIAVHRDDFLERARAAKEDPERYTVKGIDIIDNEAKTIIVNCDADDTHLETDVNNFFMAYRFHFENEGYDKKTGIEKVVNAPVESLSVNLPLGSTITCNAYAGDNMIDSADVFIAHNSGEGVYDDEFLTSVNDYTWAY